MPLPRLSPCACPDRRLQRLPRKWWMRALPGTARYRCTECRTRMLLRGEGTRASGGQVFVIVIGAILAMVLVAYAMDYVQDAAERRWKASVSE